MVYLFMFQRRGKNDAGVCAQPLLLLSYFCDAVSGLIVLVRPVVEFKLIES